MSDHDHPSLRRTLGGWQILFYGLGSMLGAGVYALIGKAAGAMGNAVWIAFGTAMIAALLTGLSYACVGSRYARAGGAAYVTHRAFGRPWLSYVVGIAVMMSGLTSMATGSQAIADNLIKAFQLTVPPKLIAILFVLLLGGIIYRGIRESMWANIACTVIEAAGLLFIIAVGIKFWGGVNYFEAPPAPSGEGSLSAMLILQGAVLTFYSFIGFEDILNVSEEVKNPRRDIPFGLIGAMILATAIYMAVAVTAVSVIPWQQLGASTTPLMDVAMTAAPWFAGIDRLFIGITIFSIANTALLNYLMGSRLIYGMSAQGLLPPALGAIHPVRRTPHIAVGVLFAIVSILILAGGVKQLAEATVLLLLAVFIVVNIALVILMRRQGEPPGGFEIPQFVPMLAATVCAALVIARIHGALTSGEPERQTAPIIAAVIIGLSMALYAALKPKQVLMESE